MLIIDDKALADTGLDYATALGLMEPADGELVVHVRRVLDEPPPQPQATERLHAQTDDGRGVLRQTHEGNDPKPEPVPTNKPTIAGAALPSGWTVKVVGDSLELRHRTGAIVVVPDHDAAAAVMRDFNPDSMQSMPQRIPRLPERGVTLGQVKEVAHALRAEAQVEADGTVQLVSAFGTGVFGNLAQAAQALNRRSFTLGNPDDN